MNSPEYCNKGQVMDYGKQEQGYGTKEYLLAK